MREWAALQHDALYSVPQHNISPCFSPVGIELLDRSSIQGLFPSFPMSGSFSGTVRISGVSDYIAPSQSCVVSLQGKRLDKVDDDLGKVQIHGRGGEGQKQAAENPPSRCAIPLLSAHVFVKSELCWSFWIVHNLNNLETRFAHSDVPADAHSPAPRTIAASRSLCTTAWPVRAV